MFERLAGKLLTRFLSKYFVRQDSSSAAAADGSEPSTGTQLGVWSGYVSLENLHLRREVVNDFLSSRGLPFELLSCTLGRVEITVPWAKLGLAKARGGGDGGNGASTASSSSSGAFVVVVVDGLHVLATTKYRFDDEAIENARIKRRREELGESETFVRSEKEEGSESKDDADDSSAFSGFAGFFKKRLAEGLINDVLEKIHIHVRDVHVRLEDVESDPSGPFGCGITLESLHVQSDDEKIVDYDLHSVPTSAKASADMARADEADAAATPAQVVRKVVQLNHFAIYWNALDLEGRKGAPPELSLMQVMVNDPSALSDAMQCSIARRSSSVPSSVGRGLPYGLVPPRGPQHSYLLIPMDGNCRAELSKDPRNLQRGPALVATAHVDALALELCDFQYGNILCLAATARYHNSVKGYRRHRPRSAVRDDPRAWWIYAIKVIRIELREQRMRWSWQRLHARMAVRRRYCDLYERKIRYGEQLRPRQNGAEAPASGATVKRTESGMPTDSPKSGRNEERNGSDDGGGDDAGGPSSASLRRERIPRQLGPDEAREIQAMEDGIEADLTVHDIVLFRAMVNANLASNMAEGNLSSGGRYASSGLTGFIRNAIRGDFDAEDEYERLLAYLEKSSTEVVGPVSSSRQSSIAVSLQTNLRCGSVSFFTPRNKITELSSKGQHQKQQRFLELSFCTLQTGYTILGDYESFLLDVSLTSFEGREIRSNGLSYVLFSRTDLGPDIAISSGSQRSDAITVAGTNSAIGAFVDPPLFTFNLSWKPPDRPDFDLTISARLEEIEVLLCPESEWPRQAKMLFSTTSHITPDTSAFWEDLSMAYINSWESTKAGLLAKAELALEEHKNIDIYIDVNCPVVSVSSGEGGPRLVVDLGHAQFVTESLAGLSSGVNRHEPLNNHENRGKGSASSSFTGPVDSAGRVGFLSTTGTPLTPIPSQASLRLAPMPHVDNITSPHFTPLFGSASRKLQAVDSPVGGIDSFSLGSAASPTPHDDEKRPRSNSRSLANHEGNLASLKEHETYADLSHQQPHVLHTCFYDLFRLRLFSLSISLSNVPKSHSSMLDRFDLLQGVAVDVLLEKSAIPLDHTMSKMKTTCVADKIAVVLSRSSLVHLKSIATSWTSARKEPAHENFRLSSGVSIRNMISAQTQDLEDVQSEASSDLNELEFLDALDDEIVDDDVSDWFEENWIADTDSVYNLDRSAVMDQESRFHPHRRRRQLSFSDVSSKSDHSRSRRRRRSGNEYLNAENLARLDEGRGEEHDSNGTKGESDISEGSDVDSFHSAMSLGDQVDLAKFLQDDIRRAEKDIDRLKNEIKGIVDVYREKWRRGELLSEAEKNRQSQLKKELKLELVRSEAELKAMRVSYQDVMTQVAAAKRFNYEKTLSGFEGSTRSISMASDSSLSAEQDSTEKGVQRRGMSSRQTSEAALRAKALLKARAHRASSSRTVAIPQHSLTKGLNRDLFFGNITVSTFALGIIDDNEKGDANKGRIVELCASSFVCTIHHRSFDTRLATSLDSLTVKCGDSTQDFLVQSGSNQDGRVTLATQLPHLLTSNLVEDRCVRVALELRRRNVSSSDDKKHTGKSLQGKISFGSVEVNIPDKTTIAKMASFTQNVVGGSDAKMGSDNDAPSTQIDQPSNPLSRLHECIMGSSSLHAKIFCHRRVPEDEFGAIDVTFKLNAFNIRLYDESNTVGAFCLNGVGLRIGRVLAAHTYQARGQVDIRVSNMQLLDISEVDHSTKAREIFGRRDCYQPLLRARLRSQLVPSSDRGGWIFDGKPGQALSSADACKDRAWNMHCGVRCTSLNLVFSTHSVSRILRCAHDILEDVRSSTGSERVVVPVEENPSAANTNGHGVHFSENGHGAIVPDEDNTAVPIRWRIDIAGKSSVMLPSRDHRDFGAHNATSKSICIFFSTNVCLQADSHCDDKVSLAVKINDLNVFRSSDDWLVLEPTTAECVIIFPSSLAKQHAVTYPGKQLVLPSASPWFFETTIEKGRVRSSNEERQTVDIALTPIYVNLSADTYCLLSNVCDGLKLDKGERKEARDVQPQQEYMPTMDLSTSKSESSSLRIKLPLIAIKLHRESESTSSSQQVVLMTLESLVVKASNLPNSIHSSIEIGGVGLFDLSCRQGACVLGPRVCSGTKVDPALLGEDGIQGEFNDDGSHYPQLAVHFSVEEKHALPELNVKIRLGPMQCLPLPSIVESCLEVLSEIHSTKRKRDAAVERHSFPLDTGEELTSMDLNLSLPFKARCIRFSAASAGFEVLLSSRNIPSYLEKGEASNISVISFRWKSSFSGSIVLCSSASEATFAQSTLQSMITDFEDNKEVARVMQNPDFSQLLVSKIELAVHDFQALRTFVHKLPYSSNFSFGVKIPLCTFAIAPHAMGEQQIVSPCSLKIDYSVAGASSEDNLALGVHVQDAKREMIGRQSLGEVSLSSALRVEIGFVDVLVYVRQVSGGVNEAIRVSIHPILDMLRSGKASDKMAASPRLAPRRQVLSLQRDISPQLMLPRKESNKLARSPNVAGRKTESERLTSRIQIPITSPIERRDSSSGSDSKKAGFLQATSPLYKVARHSSFVASVRVAGLQVTCVPGGATRLTEAPIMKAFLSDLCGGCAVLPVPRRVDGELEKEASGPSIINALVDAADSQFNSAGARLAHLELAAWAQCEVSAHYHNRRLVAWEPVVEPWVIQAQAGIDLTRALNIAPFWMHSLIAPPITQSPSLSLMIQDGAGEKIRDIGKILRSLQAGSRSEGTESQEDTTNVPVSLSHMLQCAIAPECLQLALYPPATLNFDEKILEAMSPCGREREWLSSHGCPHHSENLAAFFVLTDTKPLNINATGALYESVASFVAHEVGGLSKPMAPHWIRNETGLPIRFKEILDPERLKRGEKSTSVVLGSGSEIALSLRRGVSQTCDPHRAYITLEVGCFDRRISKRHDRTPAVEPTTSRFKAIGRVPVDMVGVYKFSLYLVDEGRLTRTEDDSAAVVVRVSLQGGTKIVSVESALLMRNASDVPMHCLISASRSGRPLWDSILPPCSQIEHTKRRKHVTSISESSCVPVPVSLIPLVNAEMAVLSVVALSLDRNDQPDEAPSHVDSVRVIPPPPFSQKSSKRGLIRATEISLDVRDDNVTPNKLVHMNVLSLRIGSFPFDAKGRDAGTKQFPTIPEQRALLFRPPFAVKNQLPVAIAVQVRVRDVSGLPVASSGTKRAMNTHHQRRVVKYREWEDLGVVKCGKIANWIGAVGSASVEVRVRVMDTIGKGGDGSSDFPTWSTTTVIPSLEELADAGGIDSSVASKMVVQDSSGVPLQLSVAIEGSMSVGDTDSAPQENVKSLIGSVSHAPRIASIYVPYWVVDSSRLDLEYKTDTPMAGQFDAESILHNHVAVDRMSQLPSGGKDEDDFRVEEGSLQLGLAGMRNDDGFALMGNPFEVLMIGDDQSNKLCIRRREKEKKRGTANFTEEAPWSDPIVIRTARSIERVSVNAPTMSAWSTADASFQPLALSARVVTAPNIFGGTRTRLVHIVNRYRFVNALDREIELVATDRRGVPLPGASVVVGINGQQVPFHFNDTGCVRFRPKEFGWAWSGPFSLRKKRRETSLRLRNKLTGNVIIVTIDFRKGPNSPGTVIVVRAARGVPFRIENHTTYPLQFGQFFAQLENPAGSASSLTNGTVLLPYHNASYAWDEPDQRNRRVHIEMADFGLSDSMHHGFSEFLGSFELDQLVPGSDLSILNPLFAADVIADGPTRVFRIYDAALPKPPVEDVNSEKGGVTSVNTAKFLRRLEMKLSHGIGVSVVDWSPRELVYIHLHDFSFEKQVVSGIEKVDAVIGNISVDNQLWITPYPVLLNIGREGKRRGRHAMKVSWCRDVNTRGGHDGITLLRRIEVSADSLLLKVDGNLSDLLWDMLQEAFDTHRSIDAGSRADSRDDEVGRVLGLEHSLTGSPPKKDVSSSRHATLDGMDILESFGVTAAAASRVAASRQRALAPGNRNDILEFSRNAISDAAKSAGSSVSVSLSKPRRKYYIEKIKVSGIKAEVSWSGSLPAALFALPDFMRPALTFEGLPIRFRSYANAHVYGTADDHLQRLKSHYLNIWRVLDVVVGLAFKPAFMVRACLFTWRGAVSSFFDGCSAASSRSGDLLVTWLENKIHKSSSVLLRDPEAAGQMTTIQDQKQPNRSGTSFMNHLSSAVSTFMYRRIIGRAVGVTNAALRGSSYFTSLIASAVRYEGGGNLLGGGVDMARLRAPRLFANQEGKDLLVEYVAGENTGRALLSRVRMGVHLGEGYIYHGEALLRAPSSSDKKQQQPTEQLLFILTSERLLLVNYGNSNYCSVVWEARYEDVIHLESKSMVADHDKLEQGGVLDEVMFWYLRRDRESRVKGDHLLDGSHASSKETPFQGLDTLLCKTIYIQSGKELLLEIARVAPILSKKD